MSNKDKKLYNYVVNTLGITKNLIMDYVNDRILDIIPKHIEHKLSNNNMEKMILDHITNIIENGFTKSTHFWQKESFETYIKKIINNVIEKRLNENYQIEVKIIKNDVKVVRKG